MSWDECFSLATFYKNNETHIQKIVESFIYDFDVVRGDPLNAVVAEFLEPNDTIGVDVHHFEVGFDEGPHSLRDGRDNESGSQLNRLGSAFIGHNSLFDTRY